MRFASSKGMGRSFIAIVLSLSLAASGCTAIGTAVGANIPRYDRTEWRREEIPLGARVRVRVRNIGADAARLAAIEGRYGGVNAGLLSVTDDDGREHELPAQDVIGLDVESGTEWKKGLLIGAMADTLVVVTAVAIARGAEVSIMMDR